MKRLKIEKLVLMIILLTAVFSFIPAAAACGRKGSIRIRPIEDWLAVVPAGRPPLGGMPYWDKGLVLWTLRDSIAPPQWDSAMNYNPKGYVLERETRNNMLLLSVNMHIKGVPFYILTLANEPIFYGHMDFRYQLKLAIDLDTVEYDDDGNIIYQTWDSYVFSTPSALVSVFLCAQGSGTFLNSYDDWEEGDQAKMNTINYVVVVGEDYTGSNPYYNILGLFEILVVAKLNFH
ncbi:MAG: hypothetical protein ACFE85_09390 [Candidatus Hodarchaeota archaeon]